MIFTDISNGTAVFVDANTFVYRFSLHPQLGPACTALLDRIQRQELSGFTSTHMLSEVAHRLMTLEACALLGRSPAGIVPYLRQHPAEVQKLTKFRQAIDQVLQSDVQVLTVSPPLVATATVITQQTGLLHNDALIVAVMQHHGLTNLASHDVDFDRVPGLTRYAPA